MNMDHASRILVYEAVRNGLLHKMELLKAQAERADAELLLDAIEGERDLSVDGLKKRLDRLDDILLGLL